MIQDSATSWIQVPIEDRNAPAHSSRKLRWAKAATKPPFGRGGVGGAPVVTTPSSRSSWPRRSPPACVPCAPSPCGDDAGGSPCVSRSFAFPLGLDDGGRGLGLLRGLRNAGPDDAQVGAGHLLHVREELPEV